MQSEVKKVEISKWKVFSQGSALTAENHSVSLSNVFMTMKNGNLVSIDKQKILTHFNRQKITDALIYDILKPALMGKTVSYSKGADGDYYMDGELSDYIVN